MSQNHAVVNALLGTLFTYGYTSSKENRADSDRMTALGAAMVFFTVKLNQKVMDAMFGFAAGVMIAASCFGLLTPAIEISAEQAWSAKVPWLPAAMGFLGGVAFLKAVELFLSKHHHHQTVIELTDLERLEEEDEQQSQDTQQKKQQKEKEPVEDSIVDSQQAEERKKLMVKLFNLVSYRSP